MVLARWAGRRSDDNTSTQQQIGNLPGRGSKGVIECSAGETTRQLLIGFVSNQSPNHVHQRRSQIRSLPVLFAPSCGSNVLSLIDLFKFKFDYLNTNLTI
jgi:hypothetical protein